MAQEVSDLELLSVIGFEGKVLGGLWVHPDGVHLIYPMGSVVVIQDWNTKKQSFLQGHTNDVSCVCVSSKGTYVASGQISNMGIKSLVYIWDFAKREPLTYYEIHKVRVEALRFSCGEKFLMSMGGRDDNNVIVFDLELNEPVCGSAASRGTSGFASCIAATNTREYYMITAGEDTLRVWVADIENRKINPLDVSFKKLKRVIRCMVVDPEDRFLYCGTTSGDIIKVQLNFHPDPSVESNRLPTIAFCMGKFISRKKPIEVGRYSLGVTCLVLLESGYLLVGAGDGTVELVKQLKPPEKHAAPSKAELKCPSDPMLSALKTTNVNGIITTLQITGDSVLIGTTKCEIYKLNMETFQLTLLVTCHTSAVFDVRYPSDYSRVFATCGKEDIKVWNAETCQELLRITVPNFTCTCIAFSADGKSIISGWNDGSIRAHTPEKGRCIFEISQAHVKGVTAIDISPDGKRIVSGGGEGQVMVWRVEPTYQSLIAVLAEHKAPVSSVRISKSNKRSVTASTDGTCIVWDLQRMKREVIMFADSQFMSAIYHPSEFQILTVGSDKKIGYWEVFDGGLVREVEGSTAAALSCLAISHDGNYFVTGANDQLVKVWDYDDAIVTHVGVGHASIITNITICPFEESIISVSADGAIFRWKFPFPPLKEEEAEGTVEPSGESKTNGKGDVPKPREKVVPEKVHVVSNKGDEATKKNQGTTKPAPASIKGNSIVKNPTVKDNRNKCECIQGLIRSSTQAKKANAMNKMKTDSKISLRQTKSTSQLHK